MMPLRPKRAGGVFQHLPFHEVAQQHDPVQQFVAAERAWPVSRLPARLLLGRHRRQLCPPFLMGGCFGRFVHSSILPSSLSALLLSVLGATRSEGFPATVTLPDLVACSN